MADLVIDTDLVGVGGEGARIIQVQASEAITRGEPVVLDAATNKYAPAQADTVANALVAGLCVSPAAADESWFSMLQVGPVIIGATLEVGEVYVLSPTKGKIMSSDDLALNNVVTILGVASSTTVLDFERTVTGITHS